MACVCVTYRSVTCHILHAYHMCDIPECDIPQYATHTRKYTHTHIVRVSVPICVSAYLCLCLCLFLCLLLCLCLCLCQCLCQCRCLCLESVPVCLCVWVRVCVGAHTVQRSGLFKSQRSRVWKSCVVYMSRYKRKSCVVYMSRYTRCVLSMSP